MHDNSIKNISVIGAGLMGHGIAQEFALAGFRTTLYDIAEQKLTLALTQMRANLDMLEELGVETDPTRLETIQTTTSLQSACAQADLVIEAALEDLPLKQALFGQLDSLCTPQTILGTNSSSFTPSQIGINLRHPQRLAGTHYFNPPFLMPLVEITRSPQTATHTVETLVELYESIGKCPVVVAKEVPGFIANRLQAALVREALSIVQQGIATAQDVDRAIKNSIGPRWAAAGTFEVSDIAGWDLKLAIAHQLFPAIEGSPGIPALMEEKVAAGELGSKTGQGFYTWTPERTAATKKRIAQILVHLQQAPSDPEGDGA